MMNSRTLKIALLCSGILAAPSIAWAASDAKTIQKATLSMTDAIAAAEKTSGGTAMEVSLIEKNNAPVFDVTIVKGKDTSNFTVNAAAATATAVKSDRVMDKLKVEGNDEQNAALGAKVSLKEAVAKVEKQTGGKATEASTEVEDKKAQYEVEVALDGKTVKKNVDATTGVVVAEK